MLVSVRAGFFTQAIFVAATQCNFFRAEVATSCDLIAILVQFVGANVSTRLFLKSCVSAKKWNYYSKSPCFMSCISYRGEKLPKISLKSQLIYTSDFIVATSARQNCIEFGCDKNRLCKRAFTHSWINTSISSCYCLLRYVIFYTKWLALRSRL